MVTSSMSAGAQKNIWSIGVISFYKSLYEADYLTKVTSSIDCINEMHFAIAVKKH